VIVGYVSDRFDGFPVAFIDDGVMRPLLPGGACCSVPAAINDRGWIVGMGLTSAPVPEGRLPWRAFLLKRGN
jgi:hypothetical protein